MSAPRRDRANGDVDLSTRRRERDVDHDRDPFDPDLRADARPASAPAAPTATAAVATPGSEELHAFAKLYGDVRFFHPGDEAASADWNEVARPPCEGVACACAAGRGATASIQMAR